MAPPNTNTSPARDEEGTPVLAVAGPTPVASTLILSDRFRRAVAAGDFAGVPRLFRVEAVFRGPAVYRPNAGRDAVLKVLVATERVLGPGSHFHCVHQLGDRDARVAILEFATEVDGRQLEGIDKLTFDDQGRIAEPKVTLRTASALQVVGQ